MQKLTGGIYDGELLNNWPHGRGKYTFENGNVYEGEFHQGDFHGQGRMNFGNGGYLLGTW